MSDSNGGTWTVRRLLEWSTPFFTRKQVDAPRLSAELLLAHVLDVPRIKLYTDYERPLEPSTLDRYRGLVQRAAEQEPIAYLTGRAHFFNLEFDVKPGVLIPRPDTETLVENVLQLSRNSPGFESPRVLDLCTGTGCIAAAIAHHLKSAQVVAVEKSESAVAIARANIERLGLGDRVVVHQGDLFDALDGTHDAMPFNLIVANPPYIPTATIETLDRTVREYEPLEALDGGIDGLVLHRRILTGAAERLTDGGRIYLEIAFDQSEAALAIVGEHSEFTEPRILKDHAGNPRVLTLRKA